MTNTDPQEGWLYTFAEPELIAFAGRISEEIPEQLVVIHEYHNTGIGSPDRTLPSHATKTPADIPRLVWDPLTHKQITLHKTHDSTATIESPFIQIFGKFREQILATY